MAGLPGKGGPVFLWSSGNQPGRPESWFNRVDLLGEIERKPKIGWTELFSLLNIMLIKQLVDLLI